MASGAAKRYAQAVFSLAKERGTLDRWLDDLASLNDLMSDPAAAEFSVESGGVTKRENCKLVDQALANSQQEARNLAHLLVQRGRIATIPDLAQIYGAAVLQERGIVDRRSDDGRTARPDRARDGAGPTQQTHRQKRPTPHETSIRSSSAASSPALAIS